MIILISGTSTGIGQSAALELARKGHTVWAGVRSQKSFDEITAIKIPELRAVFLDVCDESSIVGAVTSIREKSGRLDALVNNAGMAVGGPVEGVQLDDWRRQFETNVFGQVRVIQECLPLLRKSRGRIVNISSISGRVSSPFLGPYASSKFAFEAISDSLRRELKPLGVKVSIIEPGPIATPFWEKSKSSGLEKIDRYAPMLREIYGPAMEKFKKQIDLAERTASPVTVVTRAIMHALTSRKPKTRYLVGRGISATAALFNTLPDTWADRLMLARS